MTIKDETPAFPRDASEVLRKKYQAQEGMTLRQWYAGQALAGLCASLSRERILHLCSERALGILETKVAWNIADAMIEAEKED